LTRQLLWRFASADHPFGLLAIDERMVGQLGAYRGAQRVRIGRTDHAERARWCHQDDRLRLAGCERGIEVLDQLQEKGSFRLVVPVGLLDGTTAVPSRAKGTARLIGAEFAGRQILLLVNRYRLEIGKLGVAGIVQHQRLGAVADHNPFAAMNHQIRHDYLLTTISHRIPAASGFCSGSNAEAANFVAEIS